MSGGLTVHISNGKTNYGAVACAMGGSVIRTLLLTLYHSSVFLQDYIEDMSILRRILYTLRCW